MPSDNGFQADPVGGPAPLGPRGVCVIGSDAPQTLTRLVHDMRAIAARIDRGLKHAEDLLHERRVRDEQNGHHDDRTYQALEALAHVRTITRQ